MDEFELKWACGIVGMNGQNFQLKFKCGEKREINFSEARMKWPNLLISFCQKCLFWSTSPTNSVDSEVIEETTNHVTDLNEIICKFFF